MDGIRRSIKTDDGVHIGLLTSGSGPSLLLVHGGMGSIESWGPVWRALTSHRRVTAMDRRGRGSSSDAASYALRSEFRDIAAVAQALTKEQGEPPDVFAHSFGATCTLGAAADGAPLRRIALYEPPGPQAVRDHWPERLSEMVANGQVGRATFIFLTEIIGMTTGQVLALRDAPGGREVLPIVAATLPREARALARADLAASARRIRQSALLIIGANSPAWAHEIISELAAALAHRTVVELPGVGHDAIDTAPDLLVAQVLGFLDGP